MVPITNIVGDHNGRELVIGAGAAMIGGYPITRKAYLSRKLAPRGGDRLNRRVRVRRGRLFEGLSSPVQGTGAEGLKLALAALYERRDECPGAVPILAVHDEIVVECDEADAQQVEAWLERAMVDGMDGVLNAPDVYGPRVPVEVEVESGKTWAG